MRHTLISGARVLFALLICALVLAVPEAAAAGTMPAGDLAVGHLPEIVGTIAAAAAMLSLGTVVESITETTTPDDHKVRHVDQKLTLKAPQVNPLNTILRRFRRTKRARAEKVEYETDEVIPRKVIVSGAVAAGAQGAARTFSSAQAGYLRVDDELLLSGNATASAGTLLVTAVDAGAGTVTVVRIDGNSANQGQWGTVPALEAGEVVVRIGNNKKEFFSFSSSRTTMPTNDFNYIEEVDASLDISDRRAGTANYTRDDWARSRDRQVYDFLSNREFKLIYAPREKKVIGGENRTFCGGLDFYNTPKDLTYSAGTFSENDLIEWHRIIFSDNAGSDVRYAFHDPVFGTDLAKLSLDKVRHQRMVSKTLGFGIVETQVEGNGRIRWIGSRMFQEAGYTRTCRVIDLENVEFVPFRSMSTTSRNLRQSE
ncbi:MAG TPA: hypothetical protein EYQ24_10515, partial [Bacteroidetes bacterium]|nr:hypothetical protein [Bacteroidota bacterium]HIL56363.1 hypothetical protein [Rhodothermales bacterium]